MNSIRNILIIGGSGGIGLALVECCLALYSDAAIYATYHKSEASLRSEGVTWLCVDATSEEDVKGLSDTLPKVDILINTIGLLHDETHRPEKTVKQFDVDFFNKNIQVNVVSSILLAKYFVNALKSESTTFFVALSARVGSISDNKLGGWISYRASKAALNMAIKTISIEWKNKSKNCCVFLFHPGTTQTALSQPFSKNVPAKQLQTSEFTANALMDLVTKYTAEDSGRFVDYKGIDITW